MGARGIASGIQQRFGIVHLLGRDSRGVRWQRCVASLVSRFVPQEVSALMRSRGLVVPLEARLVAVCGASKAQALCVQLKKAEEAYRKSMNQLALSAPAVKISVPMSAVTACREWKYFYEKRADAMREELFAQMVKHAKGEQDFQAKTDTASRVPVDWEEQGKEVELPVGWRSFDFVMSALPSRRMREEALHLMHKSMGVGSEKETECAQTLLKLLSVRKEIASCLGCTSWAHFAFEEHTVEDYSLLPSFFDAVWKQSQPHLKAFKEAVHEAKRRGSKTTMEFENLSVGTDSKGAQLLADFVSSSGGRSEVRQRGPVKQREEDTAMDYADFAYFSGQVLERLERMKMGPFLHDDSVLENALRFFAASLGVDFVQLKSGKSAGWRKNFRVFQVVTSAKKGTDGGTKEKERADTKQKREGEHLGFLYLRFVRKLDLETWRTQNQARSPFTLPLSPGHVLLDVGLLPSENPTVPRELDAREVVHFMHEMGHALHYLYLARAAASGEPSSSEGYQNERGEASRAIWRQPLTAYLFHSPPLDFLETIANVNERLCEDTRVFQSIAQHHTSRQPVPSSLARGVRLTILDVLKRLQFSQLQWYLHSENFDPDTSSPAGLVKAMREQLQKHAPVPLPKNGSVFFNEAAQTAADGAAGSGACLVVYLLALVRSASIYCHLRSSESSSKGASPNALQRYATEVLSAVPFRFEEGQGMLRSRTEEGTRERGDKEGGNLEEAEVLRQKGQQNSGVRKRSGHGAEAFIEQYRRMLVVQGGAVKPVLPFVLQVKREKKSADSVQSFLDPSGVHLAHLFECLESIKTKPKPQGEKFVSPAKPPKK
uniref:Peptidase M3A/M3B catalytic domain-containing protein n=1 Tax=Chromera velia CCMP2878 TaxID=1169474 RepID=A0A0G4IBD8_9ALVE|eukprot:Cvel_12722.t1-p1 / transcript=Cvel_12722.t1 / gene=Cvel_12722 / organism=Chromera_velia_CCMP2878 / gene_product=hypothetical protein / transcript_product=hypothetical protein / location=Cvel_scaffold845:6373-10377(-) / protein_length=829 / sequence_SO=supercontig / SO=protein_coding / is_pseudo=false